MNLENWVAKVGVALSPSTKISTLDYIIQDLDYVLLMTVNPGFKGQNLAPNTLSKIKDLKDFISLRNLDVKIHVDGNVSIENIPTMVKNGGNTLISGSSGMFFRRFKFGRIN